MAPTTSTSGAAGSRIRGLRVRGVAAGSPAGRAGVKKGDTVLAVNGTPVEDDLDFLFHAEPPAFVLTVLRDGGRRQIAVEAPGPTGLRFAPRRIGRCANKCVFCFVDQLPKGMRKSLYVKDEDYRHSFLYGNYVTLAGAKRSDLDTIATLRLSPLYVSVHATDPKVRRRLLSNPRAADIMRQLRYLLGRGIRVHTQIVVCPGYNDKGVLRRSLEELLALGDGVLSVAVVPVGRTRYGSPGLRQVSAGEAREICDLIGLQGDREKKNSGFRRVFAADELFLRAGRTIPARGYYEDYPQIENGVGLVRRTLEEWSSVRRRLRRSKPYVSAPSGTRRVGIVTSRSAAACMTTIARGLERMLPGTHIEVVAVENRFFGASVTVAGLLTARDIRTALRARGHGWEAAILPRAIFNYRGYTLDGYSQQRLQRVAGVPLVVAGSVEEMVRLIGAGE